MLNTDSTLLEIARYGLPKPHQSTSILVIGAGMAGLVAAYELTLAGHSVQVLEARNRVGGRVETWRHPFPSGLYAEAGAMRVPASHLLTKAYIDKFHLQTVPFVMKNPHGICYFRNKRHTLGDVENNVTQIFSRLRRPERGKSYNDMWGDMLETISSEGLKPDKDILNALLFYDQISVRELLNKPQWSNDIKEFLLLLHNQESRLDNSSVELLLEQLSKSFTDLYQIQGGMDKLPNAFMPILKDRIRFGAPIISIKQRQNKVTVVCKTVSGNCSLSADHAIVTIPFPVLRHIDISSAVSRKKMRAIRQLHYDTAGKIFLQCKDRFWEENDGIFGGVSITDLPIRNVYYPDHGQETGRGVLTASYTWAEDTLRWGFLPEEERIDMAVSNLERLHPGSGKSVEFGASKLWNEDRFAGGAFSSFQPGQMKQLHNDIVSVEGQVHFAGEHTSLTHRWIQGAIESGLRSAATINERYI